MKYSLPNRPLGRAGLVVLSLLTTHAATAEDAKPTENAAAQPTGAAPAAAPRQPRPLKLGGPGIDQERSFKPISSGKWTGPRLADGQPAVQGHWSNTIANHNNLLTRKAASLTTPTRIGSPRARARNAHRAGSAIRPTARCRFSLGRWPRLRTFKPIFTTRCSLNT